jgi:hypothetical protein
MGEFVVVVTKDRFQGLSRAAVEAKTRTSFLASFVHYCGLLSLLIALNLLGAAAVRADTVTNAAGDIEAQLCPLLDSLTEAAVSVAQSSRTTGSTQLGLTIGLAEGLAATVQSPDMAVALGNTSKTLQKSVSRFQSQLLKAESAVDNSGNTDTAALKAVLKAVTIGQKLKALVPTLPSSDTVVLLNEAKSNTMVLHYAGDTVCFQVNMLNAAGDPSCGPVNVSVDTVGADPTDVLVIGAPDFSSATDFCLTMGPDAGMLRVVVITCNQTNSVLLYNYGVPKEAGLELPAPADLNTPTNTVNSIELAWSYTGAGTAGFKVERSLTPTGPWTPVGVTTSTTYVDTGLSDGTVCYYRLRAYNSTGYSLYSNEANGETSVNTDYTLPSVPSGLVATATSTSEVSVNWNASIDSGGSGLAGYQVYRNGTLVTTTTATSYGDSGLSAATSYCYTIVAYDNAGNNSSASPATCATTLSPAPTSPAPTSPAPPSNAVAEWYGPFASWANVQTDYGAVGDGVTDDTVAISNALANVGLGTNSTVLYFPPGTYRVTAKCWLRNREYVEVVGHSAQDTILRYDGGTDTNYSGPSTLFHSDGTVQCYFARLTFDGNSKSMTVFSQSESPGWTYFDGGNIFIDCVFMNSAPGGHGVDAGYYGDGFAGEGFTRCVFTNLGVGIQTWNGNALDGYFNDCYMANCGTAIFINPGSAHAYHTTFVNNGIDFWLNPSANFISLVSNTSYYAGTFFKATNQGLNTTPILLKGNTVIDPTGALAIDVGQPAHTIMLDNTIASTNNALVSFSNSLQIDLLAVGNTNTFASWLSISGGSGLKTNLVDNGVVSRSSLSFPAPALPVPAVNLGRTVVDMPANYTSASLQAAINSAADGTVIHIPWSVTGSLQGYLTSTITIPTNTDIRIVGDGPNSRLYWNGPSGIPMFSLPYPSHATFSHLQLYGSTSGTGSADILVSGVGSSPARIYCRDVIMKQGVNAGVRLGDCPNTVIEYFGQGIGEATVAPANGSNIIMDGRGTVKLMDVDCDSGTIGYVCTNGGSLYLETHYGEAADTYGNRIMEVGGNSTVTFLCGKAVANIGSLGETYDRATSNGYQVVDFTGTFMLADVGEVIDWMNISGATTGNIWINSDTTAQSPVSTWPIINSTSDTPIQTMNWDEPVVTQRYPDVGTVSDNYTRQMLQQARAMYSDRSPMNRRPNQTDVLVEQVFMKLGQQNLWVTP